MRPGERVYSYGATTRREFCGPMWIPGRGFVAVLSGGSWKNSKYWTTGSYPEFYVGPELLAPVSLDLDQPTTSSNSELGWYARQVL